METIIKNVPWLRSKNLSGATNRHERGFLAFPLWPQDPPIAEWNE